MNMQGKKGKEGMGKREYVKGMGKGSERGVGKREKRVGEGGGGVVAKPLTEEMKI